MGSGRSREIREPVGGPTSLEDRGVTELLSADQIDKILNTEGGRKLVRDRLLRLCVEIFREIFTTNAETLVEPLAFEALERACAQALRDGWHSPHGGTDTVEKVVRRMIEEKVSKEVAARYSVKVSVELLEKPPA